MLKVLDGGGDQWAEVVGVLYGIVQVEHDGLTDPLVEWWEEYAVFWVDGGHQCVDVVVIGGGSL